MIWCQVFFFNYFSLKIEVEYMKNCLLFVSLDFFGCLSFLGSQSSKILIFGFQHMTFYLMSRRGKIMIFMGTKRAVLDLMGETLETTVDTAISQVVDQDRVALISSQVDGKIWVGKRVQNHSRFLLVVLALVVVGKAHLALV